MLCNINLPICGVSSRKPSLIFLVQYTLQGLTQSLGSIDCSKTLYVFCLGIINRKKTWRRTKNFKLTSMNCLQMELGPNGGIGKASLLLLLLSERILI